MEGLTAKVYNGVKCYWRTRNYHRLSATTGHRDDDRKHHNRRKWRIRLNPRLKLKIPRSPRKFFIRLRDAYVSIMMRLASTPVVRGRTGLNGDGFGTTTVIKEYDEKIIIEICKNLAIRQNQNQNHQHQHQISSQTSRIDCSG